MKMKLDPITIILTVLLILGSGTGGFFIGRGTVQREVYEIEIIYTDVSTQVDSRVEAVQSTEHRSDQITHVESHYYPPDYYLMLTNLLTNTGYHTNSIINSNSITNYTTNLILTDIENPDQWFIEFIDRYLSNNNAIVK